jgi:hypothetical protein
VTTRKVPGCASLAFVRASIRICDSNPVKNRLLL